MREIMKNDDRTLPLFLGSEAHGLRVTILTISREFLNG